MVRRAQDTIERIMRERGVSSNPSGEAERASSPDSDFNSNTISNVIQMELWGEDRRGVPNEFIRSSLFTVTNHNKKREMYVGKELHVLGEGTITYTGEELRQADEDVWMQVIHVLKTQAVENNQSGLVSFQPYSMVKSLGWPATPHYRKKLLDSLKRMKEASIVVESKRLGAGFAVSLINKFLWSGLNNNTTSGSSKDLWQVWIDSTVVRLFSDVEYTKIAWNQRQELTDLGKWLHGYYSSHRVPFRVSVSSLQKSCGSKMKHQKHFKASLRTALTHLVQIGFLEEFFIDAKNHVHVKRAGSKSKYQINKPAHNYIPE